jgi:hypothetical protein
MTKNRSIKSQPERQYMNTQKDEVTILAYVLTEMSRIAKERRIHLFDVMSEAFEYYIDYCDR